MGFSGPCCWDSGEFVTRSASAALPKACRRSPVWGIGKLGPGACCISRCCASCVGMGTVQESRWRGESWCIPGLTYWHREPGTRASRGATQLTPHWQRPQHRMYRSHAREESHRKQTREPQRISQISPRLSTHWQIR